MKKQRITLKTIMLKFIFIIPQFCEKHVIIVFIKDNIEPGSSGARL